MYFYFYHIRLFSQWSRWLHTVPWYDCSPLPSPSLVSFYVGNAVSCCQAAICTELVHESSTHMKKKAVATPFLHLLQFRAFLQRCNAHPCSVSPIYYYACRFFILERKKQPSGRFANFKPPSQEESGT